MRLFIIIATKGRAREMQRLLDCFQRQTLQPDFTVIVGSEARDLEGIGNHPWFSTERGDAVISPRTGASSQRNVGIEVLEQRGYLLPEKGPFFCVFFDDDYRIADDWLEQANRRFDQGDIVGLTGRVLADGVRRAGLREDEATAFINGSRAPEEHWASGETENPTNCVYGCNMAFADTVIRNVRFDEILPLYSWQEDRDYTSMACKFGRVMYFPGCRGVHLGITSGRVSGVKFGYSQIANPIYLMKKGTMGYKIGMRFIVRALAANFTRGISEHPTVDYRGRLLGNMRAVRDLLYARSDPRRITESNF